jgi:hypothetical protein
VRLTSGCTSSTSRGVTVPGVVVLASGGVVLFKSVGRPSPGLTSAEPVGEGERDEDDDEAAGGGASPPFNSPSRAAADAPSAPVAVGDGDGDGDGDEDGNGDEDGVSVTVVDEVVDVGEVDEGPGFAAGVGAGLP